jgi:hypothetical protein
VFWSLFLDSILTHFISICDSIESYFTFSGLVVALNASINSVGIVWSRRQHTGPVIILAISITRVKPNKSKRTKKGFAKVYVLLDAIHES